MDHNVTPERVSRAADIAHVAGPEGSEGLVVGEGLAGGEGHGDVKSLARLASALPARGLGSKLRPPCHTAPPLQRGLDGAPSPLPPVARINLTEHAASRGPDLLVECTALALRLSRTC